MTFQQLQYILEIAKAGTVSGAAKALYISSSSVSISLNALEKELGYPIFARTQKGLVPTACGSQVLDYADQICRTHTLLNKVGEESVHTLRINCTDQPPVAKAYAQLLWENKDRTDLRIENVSIPSNMHYQKLVTRELDIALNTVLSYSMGYWEKRLHKGGLHRQILKTVPAVIQVGPGHRLYEAKRITPFDLRNDSYFDDPHKPLTQAHSFSSSLYLNSDKIIYLARPGVRRQALMQGLGFAIGVMPPKDARSPLRSIPLEGAFFHFTGVTGTEPPDRPEILRFLQLSQQYLDEAYPDY